jgi:hypothetical protein
MSDSMDYLYDNWPDPWSFSVEGVDVYWMPRSPYLKSDGSADSDHIIKQINTFIDSIKEDSDGTFYMPPSGPSLLRSVSSAYTVLYAIGSIYGLDPKIVFLSENSPKPEGIDPEGSYPDGEKDNPPIN